MIKPAALTPVVALVPAVGGTAKGLRYSFFRGTGDDRLVKVLDDKRFSGNKFQSARGREGEEEEGGKKNFILTALLGPACLLGFGVMRRRLSLSNDDIEEEEEVVEVEKGVQCEAANKGDAMEGAVVFCGSSNKALADIIAKQLGISLGRVKLSRFADGEISLQFMDSLRGRDVYIVQSTSPPVNENLMELLLMISTCRRSSAKKITAVVPYYGYARQDRKLSSRVPISAADVARMIEAMGVDRVVSVDLHCGQIQGFFGPRVPVDNLEAQRIALPYFKSKNLEKAMIISPDAGGVYRARKFQGGFKAVTGLEDVGLAMLIKQRAAANQIDSMQLVGSVEGSDVVIVDDMVDTAGTLCEAAKMLKASGAKRVFAFATHGLLSGPALQRIMDSPIENLVVSDSINQSENVRNCPKIVQLTIGPLLAQAIHHVHTKESLMNIFYDGHD